MQSGIFLLLIKVYAQANYNNMHHDYAVKFPERRLKYH